MSAVMAAKAAIHDALAHSLVLNRAYDQILQA